MHARLLLTMMGFASLSAIATVDAAELQIATPFGDHMILQQGKPVPIWGTSAPDTKICVQFADQQLETMSDGVGAWMVKLNPLIAKPITEQQAQTLTISDGKRTITINDVLIGDVWLGSGQSNMNRELSADAAKQLPAMPGLRIRASSGSPWQRLDDDAKSATGFSTLLLPFGMRMREEITIPIGLMVAAVGGTASARWVAPETGNQSDVQRVAALYEQHYPIFEQQYKNDIADLFREIPEWEMRLLAFIKKYQSALLAPDNNGKVISAVEKLASMGITLDGITNISELNKDQRRQLDDVISEFIKRSEGTPALAAGLQVVDDFIRAYHPDRLDLKPMWLSWHYGWGVEHPMPLMPHAPDKPQRPTAMPGDLYQKHIAPLVPFAIRGVVWDQGETGTGWPGIDQFTTMSALIRGWRTAWGDELPWIYIQKPSGEGCRLTYEKKDPAIPFQATLPEFIPEANYGLYREIHTHIMAVPNTFMVATSDLGPGIHPSDKIRYGCRAANVVLHSVYNKNIPAFGPRYRTHQVIDKRMRITFSDTAGGLIAAHADSPQGFIIAGADRHFVWAQARILNDNTIEVWHDDIPEPVAVRYAYAYRIPWANVFNKAGLPAITFRTDNWMWDGQNPTWVWRLFNASLRRLNWVWAPTLRD